MKHTSEQDRTDAARILRWRSYIAQPLARIKGAPAYGQRGGYILVELLEKIEGRPLGDIIVSHLRKKHGMGIKKPNPAQQYNHDQLKWYDEQCTWSRNNHDREEVRHMLFWTLRNHTHLAGKDLAKFLRLYYRKGDCGTYAATERAIRAALKIG